MIELGKLEESIRCLSIETKSTVKKQTNDGASTTKSYRSPARDADIR